MVRWSQKRTRATVQGASRSLWDYDVSNRQVGKSFSGKVGSFFVIKASLYLASGGFSASTVIGTRNGDDTR